MWNDEVNLDNDEEFDTSKIRRQGFIEGFSIAFFNPKIALFLVAILAQVLEPGMGMGTKLAIGILGMSIDMGWYLIVALALTGTGAVDWLRVRGQLIYRITAVALWLFAASVLYSMA
tara:strand:- start:389 stop:739 length:351 start_codon:yes stop_codon:yes gene_type:complete